MKKVSKNMVFLVVLFLFISTLIVITTSSCGEGMKKIAIFQYGPDPDTEEAYRGFIRGLYEAGFKNGKDIIVSFRNCGGDVKKIEEVAKYFAENNYDLVVPLTTPCLVAAAEYVKKTPVVFTSVYNPMAAGVAEAPDEHPENITGVYSPPPVVKTLELIKKCLPGARSIGTVYNLSEANSTLAVEKMKKWCSKESIQLITREVQSKDDVPGACESLVDEGVGAVYITGDNTVMGSFDVIASLCEERNIPLFINDPGFIEKGAAIACGPDFYSAGREGGKLAAYVLKGNLPAGIDLKANTNTLTYVNQPAAQTQGMTIPEDILDSADN